MAYAVSIKAGYGKSVFRFPTPEAALAEARDQVEHGAKEVSIRVAATGKEFTVDEFASLFVDAEGWSPKV